MEKYIVSARKYRPMTFDSVIGQKALTSTLKNAVATGRLAHSYLFCGSRGVGKTSCARIFAKTINCEHTTADGEACNECESCRSFNAGTSLNVIELDAASNNSVDDIRALTDQVLVPPASGRYRIFIIDEVHMLSPSAFNAFLKTLEEPPSHAVFILATTEKHKIIPTILSRCQIYDFNTISIRDMVDHMADVARREGITADPAALGVIARKAEGAMRDALSIFDQVAASMRGNITYEGTLANLNVLGYEQYTRLTEAFLAGDVMATWLIYKDVRDHGFDSHFFLSGIGDYLRDLMVARDPATLSLLDVSPEAEKAMTDMGAKCSPDFLLRAMSIINDADLAYRTAANKQFLVEVTLAKLCQLCSPSADDKGRAEGLKPIARTTETAAPAPVMPQQSQQPQPQQPQPQPQPQPQQPQPQQPQQPQPQPQPTARPVSRGGRKAPSLRAAAERAEAPAPAVAAAPEQPRGSAPFTPEQLAAAWQTYIDANPKAHLVVNTMRAGALQPVTDTVYRFAVASESQREIMEEALPAILSSLRGSLGNESLDIELVTVDTDVPPSAWNERRVLDHMKETNSRLNDFIEQFGLTIG